MPGVEKEVEERLGFALELAREGGAETLRFFRRGLLGVETKTDGSPVTDADRACEEIIRRGLAERYPGDGVLGEEFGEREGESGYRWVIDPIDGTFSFMHGVPLYTTLIGVERVEDGRAVAGVIHAPALSETVWARLGGGAWHVEGGGPARPARVSGESRLSGATVATTSLEYWGKAGVETWLRIARACAHTRGWPDAYAAILTATGRCDAFVEPILKRWDVAPFWPIFAEAGGRVSDWQGRDEPDAGSIVVSNGAIHDELAGVVGGRGVEGR